MSELGMDSLMPFGKYKGIEVEEIMIDDPKYLKWLVENTGIEFDDEVLEQIERI